MTLSNSRNSRLKLKLKLSLQSLIERAIFRILQIERMGFLEGEGIAKVHFLAPSGYLHAVYQHRSIDFVDYGNA